MATQSSARTNARPSPQKSTRASTQKSPQKSTRATAAKKPQPASAGPAQAAATTPTAAVRFEATLGAAPHAKAVSAAAALDLDRVPDANGRVRLLISADDARRLLDQGFEVHLTAAIAVAPLAPALVMSDTQAQNWLEEQVKGLARQGGQ